MDEDKWEQLKYRQIFDVAMPATHNSGAFSWLNTIMVRCQDVDIEAQLNGGIRVFDIRVTKRAGTCMTHHGGVTADGQELDTAIDQFARFVREHPSEKVVIELGSNLGDGDLPALRDHVSKRLALTWLPLPPTLPAPGSAV